MGYEQSKVTEANFRAGALAWCGADEGCEIRDGGARNAEAGAEIVEEGDFEFLGGFGEAEHCVARLATFFADGSAGDFALGDEGADVVFGGGGVERDVGPLEHAQKLVLAPEQAFQQTVEQGVAGSALEDAVEAGAQFRGSLGAWGQFVVFELAIEPPDHPPGDLDGVALPIVGGTSLWMSRSA